MLVSCSSSCTVSLSSQACLQSHTSHLATAYYYSSTLAKVDALRKAVQEVGKSYANKAANASNKQVRFSSFLQLCDVYVLWLC